MPESQRFMTWQFYFPEGDTPVNKISHLGIGSSQASNQRIFIEFTVFYQMVKRYREKRQLPPALKEMPVEQQRWHAEHQGKKSSKELGMTGRVCVAGSGLGSPVSLCLSPLLSNVTGTERGTA